MGAKHSVKTDMGEPFVKASWRTFQGISAHIPSHSNESEEKSA
jgi:hypothetical protein